MTVYNHTVPLMLTSFLLALLPPTHHHCLLHNQTDPVKQQRIHHNFDWSCLWMYNNISYYTCSCVNRTKLITKHQKPKYNTCKFHCTNKTISLIVPKYVANFPILLEPMAPATTSCVGTLKCVDLSVHVL